MKRYSRQASPPDEEELARRARFWSRVFLVTIATTLPLTAFALWLLSYLPLWPHDLDVHGLIAVSIGIIGILVFFIFLYKYQMLSTMTRKARIVALTLHGVLVLVLFLLLIWAGYDSPWRSIAFWGDYSLHESIKSWVIAVLVIGTLTLLGSLFDFVRKRLAGELREG
ncbi:MAG: hypothetical protein RRA94_14895 [Bacteroidota bacterium]|nr:hypothetical protein [Bacteroidota bacterium]